VLYLVLGLIFIGLELWRLATAHQHGPIMPFWPSMIFPMLIAAGAFKVKGLDRIGVLAAAVVGFVIWNRYTIGDPRWLAAVVIGAGAVMVWVGYTLSPGSRRRTLRPLLWSVAAVIVAFAIFYLPGML
jgi:peptidoglycan/LPS O-acetylase OafA/YrhL